MTTDQPIVMPYSSYLPQVSTSSSSLIHPRIRTMANPGLSDIGAFPQRRTLPDSTGSESRLNMIRNWLANCVQRHSKCNTVELRASCRPTRLIDIERHTGRVCVVPSYEVRPDQAYIALSHRWALGACETFCLQRRMEGSSHVASLLQAYLRPSSIPLLSPATLGSASCGLTAFASSKMATKG